MGESGTKTDQPIGQIIGSYYILRQLGEGGMGIVYEAVHVSLGHHVAIKVLRRNFAGDSKVLTRFFNEARAVGIVQHPGLVRVHDYQQTDDGTAYIVMEYLQGQALDSGLRAAAGCGLPLAAVLPLCHQVAAALAAAHAAGVVHCDLKPENIFLTRDQDAIDGERAKLLDFGIAKFLAHSTGKNTTAGLILGTPTYMAPEQCEGRDNLSDKVDVYALGVILYECLSGKPPFVSQSSAGIMRQHMVLEPPPLSERVPGLPPAVCELVHAMMAKTAQARPVMAEVAARLHAIREQARQPAPAAPSRVSRRSPMVLLLGAGLGIAAGLGTVLTARQLRRSSVARLGVRTTPLATDATGRSGTAQTAGPLPTPEPARSDHPSPTGEVVMPRTADGALHPGAQKKHKPGKSGLKEIPLSGGSPAPAAGAPAASAPPDSPPAAPPQPASHGKLNNTDIEPDR